MLIKMGKKEKKKSGAEEFWPTKPRDSTGICSVDRRPFCVRRNCSKMFGKVLQSMRL
jgi:hypothetical protein